MTDLVAHLRAAGCVFAEDEARLLAATATSSAELETMLRRRVTGEPLEHVLGWVQFCGRRLGVDPGVFVPRRRTEFLAELAVREAAAVSRRPVVLDLCCGAGAIGAVVVAAVDGTELHAADLDARAVACARRNLAGSTARVYEGDLYDALPTSLRGRVDVLVANAPYVPTDALSLLPREAHRYEPGLALDGGADGLDVVRRVVSGASPWLSVGGRLLVESTTYQADVVRRSMADAGWGADVQSLADGDAVVVVGRR